MKKTICDIQFLYLSAALVLLCAGQTQAQTFNFTSYYPAPYGSYEKIRLYPQAAISPATNCPVGSLYSNADDANKLYYCADNGGVPTYLPLPGVWELSSPYLYLTDTSNPDLKKVGIGTDTPSFKLTLTNDGSFIAISPLPDCYTDPAVCQALPLSATGAGTRLMYFETKAALRAGYAAGDEWDDSNLAVGSIAMGYGHKVLGMYASALGGRNNQILTPTTLDNGLVGIFGGENNTISPDITGSVIIGGASNTVHAGGTVATGFQNLVTFASGDGPSDYVVIGGAENNVIGGDSSFLTLTGGRENTLDATMPMLGSVYGAITLSGGKQNSISPHPETTAPGAEYSTITSGENNVIISRYSSISGGKNNSISDKLGSGIISGGNYNSIINQSGVISSGCSNTISDTTTGTSAIYSVVSGGSSHIAQDGRWATISGGFQNRTQKLAASTYIGYPTISGGANNIVTGGTYSGVIPGGANIALNAQDSLACGAGAGLTLSSSAVRTFVWNANNSFSETITTANSFILNGNVKMGIRDLDPAAVLEINANGTNDPYFYITSAASGTPGDKMAVLNNPNGLPYIGFGVTNPTHPLQFSNNAYVNAAGQFMDASSGEFKENISEFSLPQARKALEQMKPVVFNYTKQPDEQYVGFLADEAPAEIVSQGRDGVFALDTAAVLTKVIQDQQEKIKANRLILEQLQKELRDFQNAR